MMKSLARRFYASNRAVTTVILAADVGFLICLLLVGLCWLLVKDSWTWGPLHLSFTWRLRTLGWPAAFLLVHGVVVYGVAAQEPSLRLGLFRYGWVQRVVMAASACAVTLVVMESILNRAHVDIRTAPLVLKTRDHGNEKYGAIMLKDPELLFKYEPGSTIAGRRINSLGFREREFDLHKAAGVRRVICLGDSVTAQGLPGYAQYLNDLLTHAPPDRRTWEAYSLGVHGYTSLQGLQVLRKFGRDLEPDVVTVSFGRNDHNLDEIPDHVRVAVHLSPVMKGLYYALGRRTVGRVVLCALDRRHQWTEAHATGNVRVPPERFLDNMRSFVREIRALGAVPVLVTAPRRKMPDTYFKNGNAHSTEEYERQHDQYAEIVRQVARETGAPLLDLQRIMAGRECDRYFAHDAIHLDHYDEEHGDLTLGKVDQPGLRLVAREMYKVICDAVRAGTAP